jgi:hypothetical protein
VAPTHTSVLSFSSPLQLAACFTVLGGSGVNWWPTRMPVPIHSPEDEAAALWAGQWEPSGMVAATVTLDTSGAICNQCDEERGMALPAIVSSN